MRREGKGGEGRDRMGGEEENIDEDGEGRREMRSEAERRRDEEAAESRGGEESLHSKCHSILAPPGYGKWPAA